MLRSKLMSVVLTIFVGLGLASSALAHRMPTGAEQALQALQVAGLPVSEICGQSKGKTSCPDASCPICQGGAAVQSADVPPVVPFLVGFLFIVAMPRGIALPTVLLLFGHDAQGPPVRLI